MKGQADYEGVDMPKVTAATLAVTGLLLVALTGCSAGVDDAGDERTAPAASETTTPTESAAPLTAETAAPDSVDPDVVFLQEVKDRLLPATSISNASDEQLIAAGQQACEDMRSGVAPEDVRVVEGETPDASGYYMDSSAIMNSALLSYCPELL